MYSCIHSSLSERVDDSLPEHVTDGLSVDVSSAVTIFFQEHVIKDIAEGK